MTNMSGHGFGLIAWTKRFADKAFRHRCVCLETKREIMSCCLAKTKLKVDPDGRVRSKSVWSRIGSGRLS